MNHSNQNHPLLIDAKEAAAMLAIGKSTLWRAVRAGRLPAPVKIGGITRWRVEELRTFVAGLGKVGE